MKRNKDIPLINLKGDIDTALLKYGVHMRDGYNGVPLTQEEEIKLFNLTKEYIVKGCKLYTYSMLQREKETK